MQLGQPRPECVVGLDPIRERCRQQRFVEPHAENRGVAQHRSVGRREPIDLGGNHGLDRVRQRVGRPGRAGQVEQLEQEQRAAARPPGDLLDVVWSERLPVGRDCDDLGGLLGRRAARDKPKTRACRRPGQPRWRPDRSGSRAGHAAERPERERRRRRSALASSRKWASSTINTNGGVAEHGREKARRHVGEHVAQEARVETARLLRRRQIETEEDPEQRHPRNELRIDARGNLAQARSGLDVARARARAPTPSASAPAGRSTASTPRTPRTLRATPARPPSARRARTAGATCRCPPAPLISTTEPLPDRSSSRTACSAASSASRPTKRRLGDALAAPAVIEPTIEAVTGSAFPLARNGSIGVVAKVVRDRSSTLSVDRICPASARLMTRAAVLTASPKTPYVRRYGGPKSPVNTPPTSTPARIGMMPGRSITSRSVRSICSSSWPVLDGAPAVKRVLMLPFEMSVRLNGTS